ncbi:protein-tyrosine phosphatase-like protein [Gorgonomyces haynaldii]|nr:protein-tyrosine phosphatase-like protein [Gorgonomyces haynaldii]
MLEICPINELQERKENFKLMLPLDDLYPQDEALPWHFSWIDDGNVGGSSAPCERMNFKALSEHNVRLIVNLMERPVTFQRTVERCISCNTEQTIEYDMDLFDDVSRGSMNMLWLPVHDGSVPRLEQVQVFMKHTLDTIENGGKVLVHCQAGVGRTGVFLCLYLMIKYKIAPDEAIYRLRRVRPQSMQFNPNDWYSQPFFRYDPLLFRRNLVQERYIYWFFTTQLKPTFEDMESMSGSLDTLVDDDDKTECSIAETFTGFEMDEAGTELHRILSHLEEPLHVYETPTSDNMCSACHSVLSVGPCSISKGKHWPPSSAPVLKSNRFVKVVDPFAHLF